MHTRIRARVLGLIAAFSLTACSDDATVVAAPEMSRDAEVDATTRTSDSTTDAPRTSQEAGATQASSPQDITATEQVIDAGDVSPAATVGLPPADVGLDYQLGGGYEPPPNVGIVSRDRTDPPAAGLYNICYVNGFQVQPGEQGDWDADLLLRDENSEVVIDEDWDEAILDVSTEEKRLRIASVIGRWIEGCRADGFDAVEIDNLDTFSRSGDRISEDDAIAFVAKLAEIAHAAGLAIAQKNAVELVPRRLEMGTDFAVAEECNAWSECDGYIAGYGAFVLMIEYSQEDFDVGCAAYGSEFSVVLRDRNLTVPQNNDVYVYRGC